MLRWIQIPPAWKKLCLNKQFLGFKACFLQGASGDTGGLCCGKGYSHPCVCGSERVSMSAGRSKLLGSEAPYALPCFQGSVSGESVPEMGMGCRLRWKAGFSQTSMFILTCHCRSGVPDVLNSYRNRWEKPMTQFILFLWGLVFIVCGMRINRYACKDLCIKYPQPPNS